MKRLRYYLLFSALISIKTKAQEKQIDPLTDVRTILVHNQLSPEIVKIENTMGFSPGTLKLSGKTINQFQQSIFGVSVYPFTLVNKPYQQLFMGFGYYSLRFTEFQTDKSSSIFSNKIESFYSSLAFSYRLKNKLFGLCYVQGGLNGTDPFKDIQKTYNMIFINKIMYKASRNINMGIGFAYFTNMGYPLFLPALTFVNSHKNYIVNIDFPLKVEVEGILLKGKLRPVVGSSFHGAMSYLKSNQSYLYNYGALGYLGLRYKLADVLYLYSGYQFGIMDLYKSGPVSNLRNVGTFSGQRQWVISLNVQFAKFIPLSQE